jgi:ribonuclease P protein component
MKKSLTKRERIKKKTDFQHVFSRQSPSRRVSLPGIALIYVANSLPWNRIAIIVTKKFGKSVKRNKAKRHIREIYRNMKSELKTGFDFVIILYPGENSYEKRKEQLYSLFQKANLFHSMDE